MFNVAFIGCQVRGSGYSGLHVAHQPFGPYEMRGVVVMGCTFERNNQSSAVDYGNILIGDDAATLPVYDVIIANNICDQRAGAIKTGLGNINITAGQNVVISGNKVRNGTTTGVAIIHSAGGAQSANVTINGNIINNVGTYGVLDTNVDGVRISDNIIFNCGAEGVRLDACDNCDVFDNHIYDDGAAKETIVALLEQQDPKELEERALERMGWGDNGGAGIVQAILNVLKETFSENQS
jgi:parallel beta-helix repeat protein